MNIKKIHYPLSLLILSLSISFSILGGIAPSSAHADVSCDPGSISASGISLNMTDANGNPISSISVDGSTGGDLHFTLQPGDSSFASCTGISFSAYILDGGDSAPAAGADPDITFTGFQTSPYYVHVPAQFSGDTDSGITLYVADSSGQLTDTDTISVTNPSGAVSCTTASIQGIQINSPASLAIDGNTGGVLSYGISADPANPALGNCSNIEFDVYILDDNQSGVTSLPSDAVRVATVNGLGQFTAQVPAQFSGDCQITEYVQDPTGALNDTGVINVNGTASGCSTTGGGTSGTGSGTTGTKTGGTTGTTGTSGTTGTTGTTGTSGTTGTTGTSGTGSSGTNGNLSTNSYGTNSSGCSADNGLSQVSSLFPAQYCSVSGTIPVVIDLLLGFLGIIAVVFIIIGGYWMVVSAGSDDRFKKGRQTVTYAVIGLLVALFAYTIIALVGKTVVNLGSAGQSSASTPVSNTSATTPTTPVTTPGG